MVYPNIICCEPLDELFNLIERETLAATDGPPMFPKDLLRKFADRWPAALVIFGLALTLAWVALLVGFPLYLLKVI